MDHRSRHVFTRQPFRARAASITSAATSLISPRGKRKAELEALRAAARDLDKMIASWGASEDDLMEEYKGIRRAAREKKRNGK